MNVMDLRKVQGLKTLRDSIEDSIRKAGEASKPIIADKSAIIEVFHHYKVFLQERGVPFNPFNTEKRKQLLFVVVYLFCPAVFVGDKMPKGFREELGDMMGLNSLSIISNDTRDLMFLYTHYSDFRRGVEEAYAYIAEKMKIETPKGWWIECEVSDF